MNLKEAIGHRRSRRNYLPTPIPKDKVKRLQERIRQYNQEGGLSIRLVENGGDAFNGLSKSYGMFKGVRSLIVLAGPKGEANLAEKAGYYGELLVLEATAMGLGTCWVGGSYDRESKSLEIGDLEELLCVIPVGLVEQEDSFKEKIIQRLSHLKSKDLKELYTADAPVPKWFSEGMAAVQQAPSARNGQPVRFEYRAGEVTASVEGTSQYLQIDMGIAKAHFVLAAGGHFEFGNQGRFQKGNRI